MTTPTNHYVTITLRNGKFARGKVVYLQPKEKRWRDQSAEVDIACSEWLNPYWHKAIYATGDQTFSGQFMPHAYELGEENLTIPVDRWNSIGQILP